MRDWQGNRIPDKLEGSEMGPAPLSEEEILEVRNSRISHILGAKIPSKNVCEIIAYRTRGECRLDSPVKTMEELEALPHAALLAEVQNASVRIRAAQFEALEEMTLQEFQNLEAQLKSFGEDKNTFLREAFTRDDQIVADFRASSNIEALELLYKEFDNKWSDLSDQACIYKRRRRQIPSWLSSQLKEAKEKTLAVEEKITKTRKDLRDLEHSLYEKREAEAPQMSEELKKFEELIKLLDFNFTFDY